MKKTQLLDKNLSAMKAPAFQPLVKRLKRIKQSKKFEPFFDLYEPLNLNITELKSKERFYKNPLEEMKEKLDSIEKERARYPSLFFYGMGNGVLYKALLQNTNHKRIIVFEKEIELIFIAFCIIDFSQDLLRSRLVVFLSSLFDEQRSESIFNLSEIHLLNRSYHLELNCDYYDKYKKDILKINSINHKSIVATNLKKGNDTRDALQGIEQFVKHIPNMITRPSMQELIKKRKNKAETAIIVATGPSLDKQLKLLKKYHKRASIFCLDASYPILAKEGIKPDYVLSLERVAATSEFFDNDFGDFDKDILFVLLALTHPNTIKYLERNKRNYMLTPRSLPIASALNIKGYNPLTGMTVSHMAVQLANYLEHKNIILIGQDLAFAKDGLTHSKAYPRGTKKAKEEIGRIPRQTVKAYGGIGTVETTQIWWLFKQIFEFMFSGPLKNVNIYNATEGGARIENCIEKPFKECCEELLSKDIKKPFPKVKPYSRQEQNDLLLKAYKDIKSFQKRTETLLKECRKVSNQMAQIIHAQVPKVSLQTVYENLDKIKTRLGSKRYAYLAEVLGPSLHHYESSLAPLYLQNIQNDSDKQNKMLAWIYAHESWIDDVYNFSLLSNSIFKNSIVPLRELLEKRNVL